MFVKQPQQHEATTSEATEGCYSTKDDDDSKEIISKSGSINSNEIISKSDSICNSGSINNIDGDSNNNSGRIENSGCINSGDITNNSDSSILVATPIMERKQPSMER